MVPTVKYVYVVGFFSGGLAVKESIELCYAFVCIVLYINDDTLSYIVVSPAYSDGWHRFFNGYTATIE